MIRRRFSPPWLVAEAEGSRAAVTPSGGLAFLRSRVLAIYSPMIASGRPRKNNATKPPTTICSTVHPDFSFLSTALEPAAYRAKRVPSRPSMDVVGGPWELWDSRPSSTSEPAVISQVEFTKSGPRIRVRAPRESKLPVASFTQPAFWGESRLIAGRHLKKTRVERCSYPCAIALRPVPLTACRVVRPSHHTSPGSSAGHAEPCERPCSRRLEVRE